jgi:hypothetical protein
MKCKALKQAGINLITIEQDKKPIVIAVKDSDGGYSFKNANPSGNKKSIIHKSTKPKCTCSAQTMKNFQCPKIGTIKEGGPKKEQGSIWRVTPICSTIQKL